MTKSNLDRLNEHAMERFEQIKARRYGSVLPNFHEQLRSARHKQEGLDAKEFVEKSVKIQEMLEVGCPNFIGENKDADKIVEDVVSTVEHIFAAQMSFIESLDVPSTRKVAMAYLITGDLKGAIEYIEKEIDYGK